MSEESAQSADQQVAEYRIEDLAHHSGTTVRTIRAYQDRGLLPRPERRGRSNVYGPAHLDRLRQLTELLDRGYTLASIKELLTAWEAGRGLGGILGLVDEAQGPWTDEQPARITRDELIRTFGAPAHQAVIAEAVELGVLEPVPGSDEDFLIPSPQELAVAVELHKAGVPLPAISAHLRELRVQVEHIASRFLEFTTEHVFARYLDHHPPTDTVAEEAAELIRRLRPLAQHTVEAELARAMRMFATRQLHHQLAPTTSPSINQNLRPVLLPTASIQAVESLVGVEHIATFITAATERELQARTLDALTVKPLRGTDFGQRP